MSNAYLNCRFGTLRVQILRDLPFVRFVLMPSLPADWPWFEVY